MEKIGVLQMPISSIRALHDDTDESSAAGVRLDPPSALRVAGGRVPRDDGFRQGGPGDVTALMAGLDDTGQQREHASP